MDRVSRCRLCDSHLPVWIHTILAELGKLHTYYFGGFPVFRSFAADLNETSCFRGFSSVSISIKPLHGVFLRRARACSTATGSLNTLRSPWHGPGFSLGLLCSKFTIIVDKYIDGLLSQITDYTKGVSAMNVITKETGIKILEYGRNVI